MPTVFEDSSQCAKTCVSHIWSLENDKLKEKEEEDGCTSNRSALERSTPLWYMTYPKIFCECGVAVSSSGWAAEGTN